MVDNIVYDENGSRSILIPAEATDLIKKYKRYISPVNFADPDTGKPTAHYVMNISVLDKAMSLLKAQDKESDGEDEESFWDHML